MHDPMTVAFDIPCFWHRKPKDGYRDVFITIWHVDPETDGSDDSCGWTFPNFTEEEVAKIKKLIKDEESISYELGMSGQPPTPFDLIYWAWSCVSWMYGRRRDITHRELMEIHSLASNPADNLRHYCNPVDMERIVFCVARCYKRIHRPWYRHPKWHVHHWRIQIHPLQKLRRMFDRCEGCGKRFTYGYAPFATGERLYHRECHPSGKPKIK